MPDYLDEQRRELGFSVLGGPTTVVDIAGQRIVIDPTFDPPGAHAYLTKTAGPAEALGRIDIVLVSHDEHPDNLDTTGRQLARDAPLVLSHPRARRALDRPPVAWRPGSPWSRRASPSRRCPRYTARPTGSATSMASSIVR